MLRLHQWWRGSVAQLHMPRQVEVSAAPPGTSAAIVGTQCSCRCTSMPTFLTLAAPCCALPRDRSMMDRDQVDYTGY